MSVIFRTVERPSDPRVENSPKKYYPQLVTLGAKRGFGVYCTEDAGPLFSVYR